MRRKRAGRFVQYVATALVVLACLWFLQRLVMPKYVREIKEGSMTGEYYDEVMDHDLLFVGDCEVYANFVPEVLEGYGIKSYIRGSPQQMVWQSYYLLEDALRYETPKAVVFNVLAMQYNEPQKEEYNRLALDGMRWSVSKVKAIFASMTGKEHFLEYVFPILRYHGRWSSLEQEDLEYLLSKPSMFQKGYYMRTDIQPAGDIPELRILPDYSFGENAWKYLDKMRVLCEENGIKLILVKAPSLYPYWYDQWDAQIAQYAKENSLTYINFLDHVEEIGLDYSRDTYDAGLHLNVYGARKLTRYFGSILQEMGGIGGSSPDPDEIYNMSTS